MRPARRNGLMILVVEDEYLIRQMTTDALIQAGYEVVEAATGKEAIDYCSQEELDVLFWASATGPVKTSTTRTTRITTALLVIAASRLTCP
jgi:CheY-like chemotaxis protein